MQHDEILEQKTVHELLLDHNHDQDNNYDSDYNLDDSDYDLDDSDYDLDQDIVQDKDKDHDHGHDHDQTQTQSQTYTIVTQKQSQTQTQSQSQTHLLLEVLMALNHDLEKIWPVNSTLVFLKISKHVTRFLKNNKIFLPVRIVIEDNSYYYNIQHKCVIIFISKIKIIIQMTLYNIVIIFRECKNLEELDISGCHIKDITRRNINELPSLTSINLSNITCENMEVSHFISSILSLCLNLKEVIISNNKLNDNGASKIYNALGLNTKVLDLSNNNIGSFGFSCFPSLFKNIKNITDLNLSGNNLQNGAFSCILKALSDTNIECLNLSNTGINLKCLHKLEFKKLIFKKLLKLDLSKNDICSSGLEIIAKFVNKFCIKIEFLNLSDNKINIDDAVKFINELTNCKKMKIIVLDDKNYNNITPNFKTSHSYRRCETLTTLDLSYNRINLHELEKKICL